MMPALTVGTAVAAVIASLGVAGLLNGLRYFWPEDVVLGTLLLLLAWAVLEMGPI